MIDITGGELFKDLMCFQIQNKVIDLHNDYECESIKYRHEEKKLIFMFNRQAFSNSKITLVFEGVSIQKCDLYLSRTADSGTLNVFYRGRFEVDGNLYEKSKSNQEYYYIEFENGDKFELFSTKVYFSIAEDVDIF